MYFYEISWNNYVWKFKDECEMCYEKAEKVLKKMVENDEKRKIISEKAKEWIQNWFNEQE